MSNTSELDTAGTGDAIDGADLQASIDDLIALADGMNADMEQAADVDEVRDIGRAQQQLRSTAMGLVDRQIALLANEAKVTAAHIDAATRYARDVIAQVKQVRKKLALLGELIGFFSVVLSGNGAKMVSAAVALKKALDAGTA